MPLNSNWNPEVSAAPRSGAAPAAAAATEASAELARLFHSAVVSTRAEASPRDLGGEIARLMATPAFQSILDAIVALAARQGIAPADAAAQLVVTFRQLDRIWEEYLVQEGADRVRQPELRS